MHTDNVKRNEHFNIADRLANVAKNINVPH
jgi:hypothetical protein